MKAARAAFDSPAREVLDGRVRVQEPYASLARGPPAEDAINTPDTTASSTKRPWRLSSASERLATRTDFDDILKS